MESFDCSKAEDVERLYNLVAKAALSKTSYIVHSSAAEEIVQETFIKLFNKKPKFSSVRQAYAWIYRTCTNGAIDFLRKKDNSDWGQDSQDLLDSSRFGPEEKTHLKQAYEGLLKDLDEKEAQYFVFNFGFTSCLHLGLVSTYSLHCSLDCLMDSIYTLNPKS